MADENMVVNAADPHNDGQNSENNFELKDDVDDGTNEEFATLNAQLDQLNSILDTLEMKNDVIHAEFIKLLKSNRETRQQFQESMINESISSKKPESQ